MPVSTLKQLRDQVLATSKQDNTQIGTYVNDFINLTLQEINSPGWAFRNENHHLWSFLKRKTTFTTTSGTSDYVMERDVDKIGIMRQTSTPAKINAITDELFFKYNPNPTSQGNPLVYREWESSGLSTRLTSADTINMSSSSANDGSSFTVTVLGYVSGRLTSEVFTLNGTSSVTGSVTFDAREIFISKSGNTTGNITVVKNTGSTTLLVIGKEEVSPRFKVVSLYPIPSSTLTIYLEYYKAIRELVNDSDAPEFHQKYHYVVRLGALAKVYQFLGKTEDFNSANAVYAQAIRSMVANDKSSPDLITQLERRNGSLVIPRVDLSATIS